MVWELVDLGYDKTTIAKILLGTSAYSPILKMLKDDEDQSPINFGVKPLTKIGNTLNYDLRLVYIKKDNSELIDEIADINTRFFDELKLGLIHYLNSGGPERKKYTFKKKRKNQFETVLNEILSDQILNLPESDRLDFDEEDDNEEYESEDEELQIENITDEILKDGTKLE